MRAISPVIATVIIVSVAIAISIAVALWLTGITSGFTQTENLQIVSSYASGNSTNGWNITLIVKNTGTVAATIDNVFVNGKPYSSLGLTIYVNGTRTGGVFQKLTSTYTINPGETITLKVEIPKNTTGFTDGQMVNVKIHTASGRDYPATVTLP